MAFFQSKRERLLGGITGLILLFGGGYFFAYRPALGYYKDLDDRIQNKRTSWEEKKIAYEKSQIYRARFERMRDSLSFPDEETEQEKKDRISKELIEILDRIGIVASKMAQPEAAQIDDQFRVYRFKLTGINTTWPILATLLYEIENSDAVLEVSELKVRKNRGRRSRDSDIQVDLEISRLVEHKVDHRKTRRRRAR